MVRRIRPDTTPFHPSGHEEIGHGQPFFFTVPLEDPSQRIDVYLAKILPHLTRSRIKELIQSGNILVNDHPTKPSLKVRSGDTLAVYPQVREPLHAVPEAIPLDIIYEDRSLIIVNKPAGMVVHTGAGRTRGTLVNALLHHSKTLSRGGDLLRPGIVHRLDKDTSGVMVVAKNDLSHNHLANQFKEHSIKRRYIALTWGAMEEGTGTIDMPIGRHIKERKKMSVRTSRGRRAVTHFKMLKRFDNFSLLELALETGRTHQIRVHLSHLHHPIVGDQTYGRRSIPSHLSKPVINALQGFKRQALHAALLGFIHPETGHYREFTSPLSDDMKSLAAIIEHHAC
ncbi:MAG: RluA family pseudouridine synthase [Thermodesulfobacteriota bacterium]